MLECGTKTSFITLRFPKVSLDLLKNEDQHFKTKNYLRILCIRYNVKISINICKQQNFGLMRGRNFSSQYKEQ